MNKFLIAWALVPSVIVPLVTLAKGIVLAPLVKANWYILLPSSISSVGVSTYSYPLGIVI